MFFADFHIHSKYSRATSPDMDLEHLNYWSGVKGINLISTGDFTHPVWFKELKNKLTPAEEGLYTLKKKYQNQKLANLPTLNFKEETRFILTTELSSIYSKNNKTYRVHTLVFVPNLKIVEKINQTLGKRFNLKSDGRPILGLDVKDLVKIILNLSSDCLIIPAHIWTPWFSLFGSRSGFDRIEDCFDEYSKHIYAIETGLSSDPAMNWRLSALDKITIISNSDSHSPRKIGREANAFKNKLSYNEIKAILKNKDPKNFLFTIEFFPEEGKYHYDGHAAHNLSYTPEQSKALKNICPICHRPLTIGVLHRVDDLADRPSNYQPQNPIPYKNLIPLEEILASTLGIGVNTRGVQGQYFNLIRNFQNEFNILLNSSQKELAEIAYPEIAQAIINSRDGKVDIAPGYDGIYGKITVQGPKLKNKKQNRLF